MGAHRQQRIPLTAQLKPGADDDLVDWLASLPQGGRQSAIKAALRLALFGDPEPQQAQAPDPDRLAALEDENAALRAEIGRLTDAMDALAARLDALQRAGLPAVQPSNAPADDRAAHEEALTDDEQTRRKTRLLKNDW